jgi:hypothetical protein
MTLCKVQEQIKLIQELCQQAKHHIDPIYFLGISLSLIYEPRLLEDHEWYIRWRGGQKPFFPMTKHLAGCLASEFDIDEIASAGPLGCGDDDVILCECTTTQEIR